jgi:hypothetical protein
MMLLFMLAAVSAMVFTACGSTTKVRMRMDPAFWENQADLQFEIGGIDARASKAPQHFLLTVRSYLEADLRSRDMLVPKEEGGLYRVEISVFKYRMRSGYSRRVFGILAGKDGCTSLVRVIRKDTGELVGESEVMTYNITESMELDDVARMHAEEIGRFLAGEG